MSIYYKNNNIDWEENGNEVLNGFQQVIGSTREQNKGINYSV